MGCCFSTGDRRPGKEDTHSTGGAPPTSPPPPFEEETVKEVLLETPFVPKVDKGMPTANQEWKLEAGSSAMASTRGRPNPPRKADEEIVSEVSEVSEMCSFSESFSNATAQEKKDDEEEGVVNQRPPPRKRRVPSGGRGRGERVQARRLAGPSPERRGQVAPLRPARGRPMAGQPRNMTEENRRQRDPGENSRRRSRSPVRHGEGRRNGSDEKSPDTRESPQAVVPEVEAESLENPVVSLECFIFL